MKTLTALAIATVVALSMSACATKKGTEQIRLKCPACGYEFEVPLEPGNGN